MTSKDILEDIKTAPSFMGGNGKYKYSSQSSRLFLEDISFIEKELKILEILKTKDVCLVCLKNSGTYIDYITLVWSNYGKNIKIDINEKEFDLLKEWLENDS